MSFIEALAERFNLGLNYGVEPHRAGFYFDGTTLFCGGLSEHDVLHEVCHAIVAASEQRDLPEFGLGSLFADVPSVVDPDESDIQEASAALLSAILGSKNLADPKIGNIEFKSWDEWVMFVSQRYGFASWEIIGRVQSALQNIGEEYVG